MYWCGQTNKETADYFSVKKMENQVGIFIVKLYQMFYMQRLPPNKLLFVNNY